MPPIISRGFRGRRRDDVSPGRVPPGKYVTRDFPVLSAAQTPHAPLDRWSLTIAGEVDEPHRWTWEEFGALPAEEVTADIHCVTKWSKLDTVWQGGAVGTPPGGGGTAARGAVPFSAGGVNTHPPPGGAWGGEGGVGVGDRAGARRPLARGAPPAD